MSDKIIKPLIGLCTLIAMLIAGLSYFVTKSEFSALASNVQQNSDQLNYQSALRTYEFLVSQSHKYPNDNEVKQRLREVSKRMKHYECKLFGDCK